MPYVASSLASDRPATDAGPTERSDRPNPFLQFVDPQQYRELVERAARGTATGRLVTPLSVLQHRKEGSSGLDRAWEEELADDGV